MLLLCCPLLAVTQNKTTQGHFQIGAKWHQGFIIAHSRNLIDVSRSRPFGVEVNAHWLLNREKHIRETGLIAKRGFAAYWMQFNNPKVLGHSIAIVPYVEPLIRPWGRLYGSVQLGLGGAYVSKVYDETNNPTNLFFSLPLNFWVMLNAHLYFNISDQWQASGSFNYNHISNGGMKNPNKGMNFPTFSAGLQYAFHKTKILKPTKDNIWKSQPRNFYYLNLISSIKNVPATSNIPRIEPALLYGIQGAFGRRVGRMSGLILSMEWIHDGYKRTLLDRQADPRSAWKGGLLAGYECRIGKVRFQTHIGPYLYNPSGDTDAIYQRYGLFYQIGKHLMVGSTLKAHRHVADVFDLRIGWKG